MGDFMPSALWVFSYLFGKREANSLFSLVRQHRFLFFYCIGSQDLLKVHFASGEVLFK